MSIEEAGAVVAGYKLLEPRSGLGEGHRWLVEHVERGERAVLHLYDIEQALYDSTRIRERLERMMQNPHPRLQTPHALGEHEGQLFAVFAEEKGPTLRALMRQAKKTNTPIPVEDLVRYTCETAEALRFFNAHVASAYGFLRPDRILITEARGVLLLELETALPFEQRTAVTGRSCVVGLPEYLSPEGARGLKSTELSDVFSLGTILYEAATNVNPFASENMMNRLLAIIKDEPVAPPTEHAPQLPASLCAIIMKAMEKNPASRFQSLEALVKALGGTVSALPARVSHDPAASSAAGATVMPVPGVKVERCAMKWSELTPITREDGLEARHCAQCDQQVLRAEDGLALRLLAGHACTYFDPQSVTNSLEDKERTLGMLERLKSWLRSR